VVTQLIETPDGHRYFTVARTIERPIKTEVSAGLLAIGLGCDIRHAHKLSCADVYDLANAPVSPVGPACPICPRENCLYRAAPPAGSMLSVDRTRKTISPFPFVRAQGSDNMHSCHNEERRVEAVEIEGSETGKRRLRAR
jgi:XRE family transcriptional regulator, fatty acid utilization regulator